MKTEKIKLSQLKVNENNPRTIQERKLWLLVERLLAFPKMIEIRPVVVDEKMTALGGNMRLRAFNKIAQLSIDEIRDKLEGTKNYQRLTQPEQDNLIAEWQKWLQHPTVEIVKASTLSDAEKKEFIIADNASFGEWDYDKLANEWEGEDLNSWGLDVWVPDPPQRVNSEPHHESPSNETGQSDNNLPPELQGQDITPDDLPKIEGDDETPMERIIIVYPKDREQELAGMLGLDKIEKVVYRIDEIFLGSRNKNKAHCVLKL